MDLTITITPELAQALGSVDASLADPQQLSAMAVQLLANLARSGQEITGQPISSWQSLGAKLAQDVVTDSAAATLTPAITDVLTQLPPMADASPLSPEARARISAAKARVSAKLATA